MPSKVDWDNVEVRFLSVALSAISHNKGPMDQKGHYYDYS